MNVRGRFHHGVLKCLHENEYDAALQLAIPEPVLRAAPSDAGRKACSTKRVSGSRS